MRKEIKVPPSDSQTVTLNNPAPIDAKAAEEAILVKNPSEPVKSGGFKFLHQYRRYVVPVANDPLIKAYFEILATILLILIFIVFAIRPTLNTVAQLVKKRDELAQTDKALADKIKNLIAAQSIYSQLEGKIPLLDKALPNEPKVEELVNYLEGSISANGMTKTGLTVSKIGLTSDVWDQSLIKTHKQIPVSFMINATGRFANVNNFIAKLNNLPRLIDLDQVSVSPTKNDKAILNVTVTGKAFFLP